MHDDRGTFHTSDEMDAIRDSFGLNEQPSFTVFAPGETIIIKGQGFVVCRTKNDRLILRSAKLPATAKEQSILDSWRKDHSAELGSVQESG